MLTWQQHLAYLKYALRHKWFVLQEGRKLRVPLWMLLLHDWTKFLPIEWGAYARAFYAKDGSGQYKPDPSFFVAWRHHQTHNRHHWQYWVLMLDSAEAAWTLQVVDAAVGPYILAYQTEPVVEFSKAWNGDQSYEADQYEMAQYMLARLNGLTLLPMPDVDRREMLADWRGAGRAVGKPDTLGWYARNRRGILLHPETRAWVEEQLGFQDA